MIGGVHLFLLGLTASFGPCLFFCTPIVFPLLLSYGRQFLFIFLFTRLFTFLLLSLFAFSLGKVLFRVLSEYRSLLFVIAGLFVIFLGLWLIFKGRHPFCPKGSFNWRSKSLTSIFLGITFGLLPCAPSLAVLTYIALESSSYFHSGLLGLAFGGGEMVAPFLIAIFFQSLLLPKIVSDRWLRIIQFLSVILLFLIGVQLLLRGMPR